MSLESVMVGAGDYKKNHFSGGVNTESSVLTRHISNDLVRVFCYVW